MSAVNGIRAVAARAGVSISTVSRVFNGGHASAKATDDVMVAARDLRYHPNPLAAAMRTKAPVAELAFEHGRQVERSLIVAKLRRLSQGWQALGMSDGALLMGVALDDEIAAIERGEHTK